MTTTVDAAMIITVAMVDVISGDIVEVMDLDQPVKFVARRATLR
jgi:hypothetical protein